MLRRVTVPVSVTCDALVPVSSTISVTTLESTQRRFLKQARTPFGFYHQKNSKMHYPPWRRPWKSGSNAHTFVAPYHFFNHGSGTQSALLPQANYITGDWTGLTTVNRFQVYTLQHATSGASCKIRRFPSTYEFSSLPSRWLIGKALRTHSRGKIHHVDENMLTKKQRADYIKAGFLPK
eukprot:GILI01029415.1.p1 GENE.GILI01029415.1~~GILI01029415.1.p1  ORF type:complete len:179 (+),score=3.05 GILI01029415.1:38-574(+)